MLKNLVRSLALRYIMFDMLICIRSVIVGIAPANKPSAERFKDRISYSHQIVQVDLTSVTARDPNSHKSNSTQTFELEVEFKNVAELMQEDEKQLAEEPLPNLYFEMVQVFLNTIRM